MLPAHTQTTQTLEQKHSKTQLLTLCAYVTLILETLAATMTGDQQLHNNH